MDLRDLRTLVAVLRHGSFTGAAAELGYTQAAISQQIAGLERELGHVLLTRRPTVATEAGARLAEHAKAILFRAQIARSEVAALDDRPGPIRVVASPGAAIDLLAATRRTRAGEDSEPALVVTRGVIEAVGAVASADADVGLVAGPARVGEALQLVEDGLLRSETLAEEPYVVVLPRDHPLSRRKRLDPEALRDAPWVHLPDDLAGLAGLDALTGRAGAARTVPDEPGEGLGRTKVTTATQTAGAAQDMTTLLALVAAGVGLALLPDRPSLQHGEVVTVPLAAPVVHRNEVLTLRVVRPAVNQFISELLRGAHGAEAGSGAEAGGRPRASTRAPSPGAVRC